MVIGFTGTSKGIPVHQLLGAARLLNADDEFHFGDCVGADYQVWYMANSIGCWTVSHPPTNSKARAFCPASVILRPRPYLIRNHDIVDVCDKLIATPHTIREERRSGTWATIRYARKQDKEIIIVGPDGTPRLDRS